MAAVAVCTVLQMAGPWAQAGLLLALSAWALRGTKHAVQSLSLVFLIVHANPMLTQSDPSLNLLRWLPLISATVRLALTLVHLRRKEATPPWLMPLVVFGVVCGGQALLVSPNLSVSLLKLISFAVGAGVVLGSVARSGETADYWFGWLNSIYLAVVLLSIPLYWMPAGFARNSVGFQGITSHPQTLAVFLAPFVAWATYQMLSGVRLGRLQSLCLAAGCWMLWVSGTRTAFTAICLGLLLTTVVAVSRGALNRGRVVRSVLLRGSGLLALVIIVMSVYSDSVGPRVLAFIMKVDSSQMTSDSEFSAEVAVRSRVGLVEKQKDSIAANPLMGVGFGISASHEDMLVELDEVTGLPKSAPVESGFLPLAVLSQVGLVGASAWLVLFWSVAKPVVERANGATIALFGAGVGVNIGEVIFFSFGGMGLLMWLVIAVCVLEGARIDSYAPTQSAASRRRLGDRSAYFRMKKRMLAIAREQAHS
ncbi:MAG: hypothetical protein KJZ79_04565 [Bryobacteraceae bacterium]|nr:hypothetical protein [Bryobacteraceae bacterium]